MFIQFVSAEAGVWGKGWYPLEKGTIEICLDAMDGLSIET